MTFTEAIGSCFRQYAGFAGRACRSEYWFFALFGILVNLGARMFGIAGHMTWVAPIAGLVLLLPHLAVSVRRLHDIDRSGWWLLIILIPLVGTIVLIVWHCTPGTAGRNRFGSNPLHPPFGYPA